MILNIDKAFEELFDVRDQQKKANEFERLLGRLLFDSGFEILQNPKAASPRQTDLFARRHGHDFLIEVKWLSRKIDISHIDALRSRLRRIPSDVVGCIFSMSDYTVSAVNEVERNRDREILLFDPLEVHRLFTGRSDVIQLIEQKSHSLRLNAKMLFSGSQDYKSHEPIVPLPSPEEKIYKDGICLDYITCRNCDHDMIFSTNIPDIGWNVLGGNGIALRLDLDIEALSELSDTFALLHNKLHLSTHGSFAIHQKNVSWHGFGIQKFLKAIENWDRRYRDVSLNGPHHSEELVYFDHYHTGFLILTSRLRVGSRVYLHTSDLEIRLPGTPIDLRPFQELCSATNNPQAYFNHLKSTGFYEVRIRKPVKVEAVAHIKSANSVVGSAVSGLVIKNPYFKKRPKILSKESDDSPFFLIGSSEYLVCSLADWLDPGDVVDRYFLVRLEGTWTGNVPVFRPVCTWGKVVSKGTVSGVRGHHLADLQRGVAQSERIQKLVEGRVRAHTRNRALVKGRRKK